MPAWQRAYLTLCVATIGFAFAYVLCDYAGWPRLTYFPYEREWRFVSGYPGAVPMAYVGTLLWGIGGGLVGALSGYLGSRLWNRPLGPDWTRLIGAWSLAAFAYGGLYFTWNLWPF